MNIAVQISNVVVSTMFPQAVTLHTMMRKYHNVKNKYQPSRTNM